MLDVGAPLRSYQVHQSILDAAWDILEGRLTTLAPPLDALARRFLARIANGEKGHRGYASVKGTLAKYADLLADRPEDRAAVRDQKAEVAFLDYDWALNDVR